MSAEELDEDARKLTNRAAVADARCAAQAKKSARGASAAASVAPPVPDKQRRAATARWEWREA